MNVVSIHPPRAAGFIEVLRRRFGDEHPFGDGFRAISAFDALSHEATFRDLLFGALPGAPYWLTLAGDYAMAFAQAFGASPSRHDVLLAMAVAEFETMNGRAWPGTYNFGAVQLRGLTSDELARFHAGTLKAGDTFAGNPGGVLHVDTHPPATPYPVWFAAFPTQVDGVRYFLRTLYGHADSRAVGDDDAGTPADLAACMYLHCYFEGSHPGGRPCGKRARPYTAPEQANVDAYGAAVAARLASIEAQLAGWFPPGHGEEIDPAPGPDGVVTLAGAGDDVGSS